MTKLKLEFAKGHEFLSREEMKQVYGGYMSGSDDTGSGTCYWYRCMCSEPISVMAGSTMSTYVDGNTFEEAKRKAESDCNAYNRVDCVRDKAC